MASQEVPCINLKVMVILFYVRGYHAYTEMWSPVVGETLWLKREPTDLRDRCATVVGHVPYNLAPRFSQFILRDVNKAFAKVTGQKVNRGAGYMV